MVASMKLTQDWCPMVNFCFTITEHLFFTTTDAYHKELQWHWLLMLCKYGVSFFSESWIKYFTFVHTEMMLHLPHPHSACDKRKMIRKWSWKKKTWRWLVLPSSSMVIVLSLYSTQNQGCGCHIRSVYIAVKVTIVPYFLSNQLCSNKHSTGIPCYMWVLKNVI